MDIPTDTTPETPAPAAPSPGCGTCTLCCKLLGVVELEKPENRWCPECRPGRGCGIYAGRPASCRDFACAWLVTAEEGLDPPAALRPDRCHVVFHEPAGRGSNIIAHVEPSRPRAWTEGAASAYIASVARAGGTVAVRSGERTYIVDKAGIRQARVSGLLPDGGLTLEPGPLIGRLLA